MWRIELRHTALPHRAAARGDHLHLSRADGGIACSERPSLSMPQPQQAGDPHPGTDKDDERE